MADQSAVRLNESDTSCRYREWPEPAAAERVRCWWKQHVAAGTMGHTQRVVPDACADVIAFSTGETIVVGPTAQVALVDLPAGVWVRGLRLRTAALASVLGCPGLEIRDRTMPLSDLLSDRDARSVAAAVWEGRIPEALAVTSPIDRRVRSAVRRLLHGGAVAPIAVDLDVSTRQLHRLIVHHTGLAPASLRRIGRLQRFLSLAERAPLPTVLARLAADVGYADHAHLAREVRALTHCAPTELLRERREPGNAAIAVR